jgi:hypothetical protein
VINGNGGGEWTANSLVLLLVASFCKIVFVTWFVALHFLVARKNEDARPRQQFISRSF